MLLSFISAEKKLELGALFIGALFIGAHYDKMFQKTWNEHFTHATTINNQHLITKLFNMLLQIIKLIKLQIIN